MITTYPIRWMSYEFFNNMDSSLHMACMRSYIVLKIKCRITATWKNYWLLIVNDNWSSIMLIPYGRIKSLIRTGADSSLDSNYKWYDRDKDIVRDWICIPIGWLVLRRWFIPIEIYISWSTWGKGGSTYRLINYKCIEFQLCIAFYLETLWGKIQRIIEREI